MTLYKCFDAAFPPQSAPPGAQAVLGYLGRAGQTPHVWTMPEWDRFAHLRQYPAWVPDFGADPGAEAVQAVLAMLDHGWAPRQAETRAIVCDLETSVHPGWYQAWADRIGTEGFVSVAYGSLSTVLENAAAHLWVAAWDSDPHLEPGQTIHAHQYQSGPDWDLSVIDEWLWDRGGEGARHG
jgi:hypothetical protein